MTTNAVTPTTWNHTGGCRGWGQGCGWARTRQDDDSLNIGNLISDAHEVAQHWGGGPSASAGHAWARAEREGARGRAAALLAWGKHKLAPKRMQETRGKPEFRACTRDLPHGLQQLHVQASTRALTRATAQTNKQTNKHTHTHTRTHAHTRTRTHAHIRTRTHTHTHTHTRTRARAHARTHARMAHTRTRARAHASTRARTHARTGDLPHGVQQLHAERVEQADEDLFWGGKGGCGVWGR